MPAVYDRSGYCGEVVIEAERVTGPASELFLNAHSMTNRLRL
jgi:hypothetical protein